MFKRQCQTCRISDKEVHGLEGVLTHVYEQKCIGFITKTLNNKDHYLHNQVTVLPHGYITATKSVRDRMRETFLPEAIKHFNAKYNR